MAKIVFFCIPAHGHTNPTLNVVRELVALGHQVWYYSYNMLRKKIEATGAIFVSCDEFDMEQRVRPEDARRIGTDLAFSVKILVDTTLALDEAILRDMQKLQPDCIVADSMAVWGKAIAKKLNIPHICSTTTFAFNEHSAKIMKQSPKQALQFLFALPKIQKQLKRLQDHGYPFKSILDILQNDNDTHTIVYTSPEFQPCSETFSDKYTFVGPSIRPAEASVRKRSNILIYISMGTVNNEMLPLYQRCLSALENTGHHIILSIGDRISPDAFGKLPENVEVCSHVDQIAVLQQADVFLTHCGMNSVSEALYFGVPLLMIPQTVEQKGVAARVADLGAGILLPDSEIQTIQHLLDQILTDISYRNCAHIIAECFHRCSGATGAAKKILDICHTK